MRGVVQSILLTSLMLAFLSSRNSAPTESNIDDIVDSTTATNSEIDNNGNSIDSTEALPVVMEGINEITSNSDLSIVQLDGTNFSLAVVTEWINEGYIRATNPFLAPIWSALTSSLPDWFLISFGQDLLQSLKPVHLQKWLKEKGKKWKWLQRRSPLQPTLIHLGRLTFRLLPNEQKQLLVRTAIKRIPDQKGAAIVRRFGPNLARGAHTYIATELLGLTLEQPKDRLKFPRTRHTMYNKLVGY